MIPQTYLDKTMPRVAHASVENIQYAELRKENYKTLYNINLFSTNKLLRYY